MQKLENEELETFSAPLFGIFGDETEQEEDETEGETLETAPKQPETTLKEGETIVFETLNRGEGAKQKSLTDAKQQVELVVSQGEEEEFPGDDRLSPAMLKQLKERLTRLKGKARSYASRGNKYEERALACEEKSDERLDLTHKFKNAMVEAQKAKAEAEQLEKEIALQERYMN